MSGAQVAACLADAPRDAAPKSTPAHRAIADPAHGDDVQPLIKAVEPDWHYAHLMLWWGHERQYLARSG